MVVHSEVTYPWLPAVTLPANFERLGHWAGFLVSDWQACKKPEDDFKGLI